MKRILVFILINTFLTNMYAINTINRSKLLKKQFHKQQISSQLKENIPFLNLPIDQINQVKLTENNIFSLSFYPKEKNYLFFSRITGLSIFNTQFTVSWYIFTNQLQIPNSTKSMMNLLNTKKPLVFSSLTYMNGRWCAQANLPYQTLDLNNYIYAYISFPNTDGVLIPLVGQSFYQDQILGISMKKQMVSLNAEILNYWQAQGYL